MDESTISKKNEVLNGMISWYEQQVLKYAHRPSNIQTPELPPPPLVQQPLTEVISLDQVEVAITKYSTPDTSRFQIPRVIHQLMPARITPEAKSSILSWKQLHPNWYHVLWNSLMLDQFMTRHYSSYQRLYASLPYDQKMAAIRYFLLHRYGGIYSSVSMRPLVMMESLFLSGPGIYLVSTPRGDFTNELMASSRQQEFWMEVIREMQHPYLPWWTCWKTFRKRYQTGSYLLDRVAKRCRSAIILLPTALVCPCTSCESTPCTQPGAMIEILSGDKPQNLEEKTIRCLECYWNRLLLIGAIILLLLIIWRYQ
jgi:mannosyltransferase OCH1-like enzyme